MAVNSTQIKLLKWEGLDEEKQSKTLLPLFRYLDMVLRMNKTQIQLLFCKNFIHV